MPIVVAASGWFAGLLRRRGKGGNLRLDKSHSQLELQLVETGRRCERAVVTAYRELRAVGTDDLAAFQSCTTLYRIHHPEAGLSEARALVSEWIDHHITRAATGATPGCECEDEAVTRRLL